MPTSLSISRARTSSEMKKRRQARHHLQSDRQRNVFRRAEREEPAVRQSRKFGRPWLMRCPTRRSWTRRCSVSPIRCSAGPSNNVTDIAWPREDRLHQRHRQGQGADGGERRIRTSTPPSPSISAPATYASRLPCWCRKALPRSASRPRSTRCRAPTGAARWPRSRCR